MTNGKNTVDLQKSVSIFENAPSTRFLQDRIDQLPVSADAKALLMDLAELTLTVGGKVLAFGRKILAIVFDLASKFKNVLSFDFIFNESSKGRVPAKSFSIKV